MSANGSALPQEATEISDRGKGKQVEQQQQGHDDMMEDGSESEESGVEQAEDADEDEEEGEEGDDNLEAIDPSNIIYSSKGRTRGKQIDWAEAEQKARDAGDDMDEDDDDDDDEDFEVEDEAGDGDRMEE